MGPGAEPVEEDYFQDEPVNVAKRFVGVAGEGPKRRGWARRRENIDWVGRLVARVRCGCQGCVWVLEGWRSGGCGFSAVGIRVRAGKAGGKYEENSNGNLWVTLEISLSL